jgi:ppGpp synthetase/RelA/SpoT-type nucleotidyltranferase
MAWPKPSYSREQVNKAGRILATDSVDSSDYQSALEVLDNWRYCHGYPLNTFQMTLRDKLKAVHSEALVAQRLKRAPSIISKLKRFKKMELARMHDIGGLRAVVPTIDKVIELQSNYINSRKSSFRHELARQDDYIKNPKETGYRSMHLVYRYKGLRTSDYDGLRIELQIRTRLQHVWATAVETAGTFIEHSLKSSEGPKEWLDFFSLTGSAFAHLEGYSPVPGYTGLSPEETYSKVVRDEQSLKVSDRLRAFSIVANKITSSRAAGYYVVTLDLAQKSVTVQPFSRDRLDDASQTYSNIEREISGGRQAQAVLVSAGSLENLKRAFPSFFLDTHEFLQQLKLIKKKVEC